MLIFKYKNKKMKYKYTLAASVLFLLQFINIFSQHNLVSYVLYVVIYLIFPAVLLIFSVSGLRERVEFHDEEACYIKSFSKKIRYDRIKSIRPWDKADLAYVIVLDTGVSYTWKLSYYESDEDIGIFKESLAELMRRARQTNPNVEIDGLLVQLADCNSEYSIRQKSAILQKRSALKGLGGWLIYFSISIIFGLLMPLGNISNYMKSIPLDHIVYWSISLAFEIGKLIFLAYIAVLFYERKFSYKQRNTQYLVFDALYVFITNIARLLMVSHGLNAFDVLFGIAFPTLIRIWWVYAWIAYSQQSIRARNTFTSVATMRLG